MGKFYYKSPIGNLEIAVNDGLNENALISLTFVEKVVENKLENNFVKEIKKQLDEYFSGKRKNFDIKINPEGTDFQKKVWNELLKIPYGVVKSYSEIAEKICSKSYARAVGNACNKNPILIIVPCHRVISNNGIGGYALGAELKNKLIKLEKQNLKIKYQPIV